MPRSKSRMRKNPEGVNFEKLHELYQSLEVEIRGAMARTLWLMAWLDFVERVKEEEGDDYDDRYDEWTPGNGGDWDDYAPETPSAAQDAALSLERAIAIKNDLGFAEGGADDVEILRNIGDMEDEYNEKAVADLLKQLPYPLALLFVRALRAEDNKKNGWTFSVDYALSSGNSARLLRRAGADEFGSDLAMMGLGTGVSWFDDHAEFDLKMPRGEMSVVAPSDSVDGKGWLEWYFDRQSGSGEVEFPNVEDPEEQPPMGPHFVINTTEEDNMQYIAFVEIDGLPQYPGATGWAAEGAMAALDSPEVLGADLPSNYFQTVDSTRWNRETQTIYRPGGPAGAGGMTSARYELRNQYQNEMMTRMLASTYDLNEWRMGDLVWANQNDWNYGTDRWVIGVRGGDGDKIVVFTNGNDLGEAIDIAADWVLENQPAIVRDKPMKEMRDALIEDKGLPDPEMISDADWREIDEQVDAEYETHGNYSTAFDRETFFVIAHNPNVQQLMELAR